MTVDATSLERLHDIVVPPPVPWWPPAPGWLWLAGFVSLVCLYLAARGLSRWQQNRYRREALAELARLASAATDAAGTSAALAGLSVLLKRTALTAYGRETVASLTGTEWFAFLDRTGGTHFGDGLGRRLESAVYGSASAEVPELAAEVRRWIREHGPAATVGTSGDRRRDTPAASVASKAA